MSAVERDAAVLSAANKAPSSQRVGLLTRLMTWLDHQSVVDLAVGLIDPQPLRERLEDENADHALTEAIRQNGQQVPILVRPQVPANGRRYQLVYGRRRLRAAETLKRPVKAIIAHVSDEEVACAQLQENTARLDYTYVELSMFAAALEASGSSRSDITAALQIDKFALSKLLKVARCVPRSVITAVGRAPKVGRPRWDKLADALAQPQAASKALAFLETAAFKAAASDDRVSELLRHLGDTPTARPKGMVLEAEGVAFGEMTADTLRWDNSLAPGFGALLAAKLPGLIRDWQASIGRSQDALEQTQVHSLVR